MSTQEERLQIVESDLKHFKTKTVKAYGDMAVDLTLVKGISLKSMERLTVIETKLDNHTERFNGLEITLSEHSRALYDHTTRLGHLETVLGEHTTVLNDHTTVLNDHTTVLNDHTTVLNDHTTVLNDHTARFSRLETTLSEHTTLLAQILARLPEKP
jgi:ABC-type transporter Mla subunit MlaD